MNFFLYFHVRCPLPQIYYWNFQTVVYKFCLIYYNCFTLIKNYNKCSWINLTKTNSQVQVKVFSLFLTLEILDIPSLPSRQFFVSKHVDCFGVVLRANVLVTHGQGARDEGEKSGAPRQIIRDRSSEFWSPNVYIHRHPTAHKHGNINKCLRPPNYLSMPVKINPCRWKMRLGTGKHAQKRNNNIINAYG